ncbi:M15 family metallopeptidase [Saccharospirillum salsuginis]|uniref:Twin-arginine translocation pathway signal protein n=1 Tax=Saccharospirillum salsuginis TaxID=418750 RepID=A0A918NDH5_9GAMM|nr:M15 family metallopeptidase [Saccharospirillum salsuginis]GGX64539.1 twin-arginine translocation pathway signal protein [Saccharospirillum salsuginis]
MNRRQFLYQALSVSAVAIGAGYATLDMARRSGPEWTRIQADQARKAAEKALKNAPPMDEAMVRHRVPASEVATGPSTKTYARPAESMQVAGPATDTPDQPIGIQPEPKVTQPDPVKVARTKPQATSETTPLADNAGQPRSEAEDTAAKIVARSEPQVLDESAVTVDAPEYVAEAEDHKEKVRQKVQHFEYDFSDDVFITGDEYQTLVSILERLNRVQAYVGHGNFNVLSFDSMLRYARYQSRIGDFPQAELDYMEKLFYDDVSRLGFFGDRVVKQLTHVVKDADIEKIPGTGHYLFKGHSQAFYDTVRNKVGDSLVLTSGIRGIVKQYHLFMAKVVQAEGNLSRASRSLAPPGHSYHAIGDFDVGRVGGGLSNFTSEFAETDVFKRLQDLGFVQIRYTTDNDFGVRYEPWHIRVV